MRRRALLWGSAGLVLGACSDGAGEPVRAPCTLGALETIAEQIQTLDRGPLLQVIVDHLAAGVGIDDLYTAAFHAGLRASSAIDHSNHPVKAVAAARELSLQTPGRDRYVALLWAVDGVSANPGGIRNPRDTGTPMPAFEEGRLPPAGAARARFDVAMERYDRDGAEQAIVSLHRGLGPMAVVEAVCAWAGRSVLPNGHLAIAAAQYLRILERSGYACAELAWRHLAYTLATANWKPGEEAFEQSRARVPALPADWEDGVVDDTASLEFLAALRVVDDPTAAAIAAGLLADGLAPQSLWDATFLHAAEAAVFGGDEHAISSTTALYDLYQRATVPETRALLVLQAPAYAARMSSSIGGIESIEPAASPPNPEAIVAGAAPELQLADALGYLEGGGSEEALVEATHLQVVRHHAEWHGIKIPVAMHEQAQAVSPSFRARMRAAHATAYARGGGGTWERYDEALSAVAVLPP